MGDPVCVQNAVTRRWDRKGTVLERYENARRYLIRLESGMIIRRNRIHLRKRFTNCDFVQDATSCKTGPNVLSPERYAETNNDPH